jgi:hypothetical protein
MLNTNNAYLPSCAQDEDSPCEHCWITYHGISIFHPDQKLPCHCGWLHPVGTDHNPDWFRFLLFSPGESDCSTKNGPSGHDCDCGACYWKRTSLIELGWDQKYRPGTW